VAAIELLIVLRASKDGLASIDHNNVIAHIHERRPLRIPFARQNCCYF
jgi:hypothetical protein